MAFTINLGDPDFFQKLNEARPEFFDQEKMVINIEEEKMKNKETEINDEIKE